LPLVVAGFTISFVLVGGGIDTVSVFLNALAQSTDWSRSALSLAVSIGALSAALSTPAVGVAVDRFGVRVPMTAGAALLAVGFAVLTIMNRPWQFAAANVFLGAGFAACAIFPITVAVTVLVPVRTALALGIVSAGSSAGTLVLAPAAQAVIGALGWRGAYVVMGTAVVLTPLPFLVFALPRGRLRQTGGTATAAPFGGVLAGLRRPGIVPLAAVMILPGFAGFSVSVHLVPYLSGLGHAATLAAAALGATVGISAIGKVGGGYVADRVGTLRTLRLALVTWTLALAVMPVAGRLPVLTVFIIFYGLAFGTELAVIPAIAVAVLGTERFGSLFGVLQLGAMLASAVGPVAAGLLFDATGHYQAATVLWVTAMAAATAVAFWMKEAGAERVGAIV
jgi:MFS transporter, OFA family, oxalate/formate antiporter